MKKITNEEIKKFVSEPLFDEKIILKKDNSFPKISIVTPSLNQGQFLEKTILSVLNQNYPNLEYIIIDGGSTDGSMDIIKKYEKYIDYWVSEPDKGMYDAINKGIRLMNGDIWACLNSDDQYYLDTLEKIVFYFSKSPDVDIIFGNLDFVNDNGEFIYRKFFPKFNLNRIMRMNYLGVIPQPAVFLRRSVIENVGYFDPNYNYASDMDYFIRAGKNCKIQHINLALTRFRLHSNALSVKMVIKQLEESESISKKYYRNDYNKITEFWDRLYLKLPNLRMVNFRYIIRRIIS
jgi:glycosyltransferase involved in cell wall biosynthesis